MDVDIREITGNWDRGYVLHKHVLSSRPSGYNEYGYLQFDTTRSEIGEALFKLKYRGDWSQVSALAAEVATSIIPLFDNVELIVPMPASNVRRRQPVDEIATELAKIIGVPVFDNIIVKAPANTGAGQLKDMNTKQEKLDALAGRLSINDSIPDAACWNALLLDDLFDTGASMEAACAVLRTYQKIKRVYVAALTWK